MKISKKIAEQAPEKIVNAALYIDDGSMGVGVFAWAALLKNTPGINIHLISASDIRDGKLDGMDLFLMPGGIPARQYAALKEDGVAAVHKFIADGGSYIGTCAGLSNVLNDDGKLKLLPFHRRPDSGGFWATLEVDINERGAEILNVPQGRVLVRYACGPIPDPDEKNTTSPGEILAVYKNTVSYIDKPEGNFFDKGAVIYGSFGKGKVIATGFHPELWASTHHIAMGCIYAATGVKMIPAMPVKSSRPLRVGYYCEGRDSIGNIEAMLRLNAHLEIDIIFISNQLINEGGLRHLDMLVMPDANADVYRKTAANKFLSQEIARFIKGGGKVVLAGRAVAVLPDASAAVAVKDNQALTPDLLLGCF